MLPFVCTSTPAQCLKRTGGSRWLLTHIELLPIYLLSWSGMCLQSFQELWNSGKIICDTSFTIQQLYLLDVVYCSAKFCCKDLYPGQDSVTGVLRRFLYVKFSWLGLLLIGWFLRFSDAASMLLRWGQSADKCKANQSLCKVLNRSLACSFWPRETTTWCFVPSFFLAL